jgi:ribonuclease HI
MSGDLFKDMKARDVKTDQGADAGSFPSQDAGTGWYTAHCDGGSRGYPGPAGYGAVVEDPAGHVVARLSKYLGRQTNNYAEYAGLLAVLEWALARGVKRLRVVSDSELMVNQMKGRYKVASPGLKPLWEEAKQRAVRLDRFEMSHTLRGGNKEADKLANQAMDEGSGARGPATQGPREQGNKGPASPPNNKSAGQRASKSAGQVGATGKTPGQVLEGYVKDGVVHLLDGELPEGVFVKVTRES